MSFAGPEFVGNEVQLRMQVPPGAPRLCGKAFESFEANAPPLSDAEGRATIASDSGSLNFAFLDQVSDDRNGCKVMHAMALAQIATGCLAPLNGLPADLNGNEFPPRPRCRLRNHTVGGGRVFKNQIEDQRDETSDDGSGRVRRPPCRSANVVGQIEHDNTGTSSNSQHYY